MKPVLTIVVVSGVAFAAIGGAASTARAQVRDAIYASETDPVAIPPIAAPMHRIIYMNRGGGTYTMGVDDSRSNSSQIVDGTRTVPAFPYGDTVWNDLMACTRTMYSAFNVTITDVDPGANTAHVEAVVGGRSEDIGYTNPIGVVGGVAIVPTCSVGINETAVVFIFPEAFGPNIPELCWTAAQETAHAFGLEHEYLCEDPMTYLYSPCGTTKSFQNVDAQCGEDAPRACQCGATQNSVTRLLDVLGQFDASPPTLDVTAPVDGATVPLGFHVEATASDNTGISKVELLVDGDYAAQDPSPPFSIVSPRTLPLGPHDLEVRAYDSGGNFVSENMSVTIIAACATHDDCASGETCEAGACWVDLGGECSDPSECFSNLCTFDGEVDVCSQNCGSDNPSCPGGFECKDAPNGGSMKCFQGGGGCAASPGRGGLPYGMAGLLVGLLLVLSRRRR